jgi:tryptophan-rich hypothetical protein
LTSVPTALNANKLLLSKWTAVEPREREKHFMVVKVLDPLSAGGQVTHVQIEAVISGRVSTLAWRELADTARWKRGWTS